MNIFFVTIIVSSVTAMLTSMIAMKFHLIMLKKWLADFFGSIISVVGKSTVEIMEPFLV